MRLLRLLPLLGLMVLMGCPTEPTPAPTPEPAADNTSQTQQTSLPAAAVEVTLREVLAEIDITGNELSFRWQAPPEGAGNLVDPSEYFWRSTDVTLTEAQFARIRQWTEDQGVYNLDPPEKVGDATSYPAVWFHRLHVSIDGREFDLSWTDADEWDDMSRQDDAVNAVETLKSICAEFTRANEDTPPEGKK